LLLTSAALERSSLSRRLCDRLLPLLGVLILIAPGYNFGQREHLMLMAALPYTAAAAVSLEGPRLRLPVAIAIGLFAALGFCLKPYFLFVPLCVEAWLALRNRSLVAWLRPEFLLIPVFGALYLAAVFAFAPSYIFVELAQSRAIYWAYNTSFAEVVKSAVIVLLPSLAGWLALIAGERNAPPKFAQAAACAASGAVLSAMVQCKGFSYHFVPAAGLLTASCLTACFARLERPAKIIPFCVAVLVLFAAAVPALKQMQDARLAGGTAGRVHALAETFRRYAGQGGFVYAFITSPRDIHPAVIASGAKWATEACCIYHLPAAVRAGERPVGQRAAIRAIAAREVDRILGDLASRRPAVIAVDAAPHKLAFANLPFDYVSWLSRDERFRRLWANYAERGRIGDFRIFIRRTPSSLEAVTRTR
jgi:hypothetical protein